MLIIGEIHKVFLNFVTSTFFKLFFPIKGLCKTVDPPLPQTTPRMDLKQFLLRN